MGLNGSLMGLNGILWLFFMEFIGMLPSGHD